MQEDDFIGTKFGPSLQLEVIGWFGEKTPQNKKYTVECSICKQDQELFGDGRFLITKSKIKSGRTPCGCSSNVRWTKYQYSVRLKRECIRRDYRFICFESPFSGNKSVIYVESPYGEVNTVTISNFLKGQDSKRVADVRTGLKNRQAVKEAIKEFVSTGAYWEGTIFERSLTRKDKNGWSTYWDVFCPECDETYQAYIGNLKRGLIGCSCSQRKHDKAYIHIIESHDTVIGIKYGITSKLTGRRLYDQNKKTDLLLTEFGIWQFDSVSLCRKAELLCKRMFAPCVTREQLPDGFSETAIFSEIEEVIKIYENHGGVRVK